MKNTRDIVEIARGLVKVQYPTYCSSREANLGSTIVALTEMWTLIGPKAHGGYNIGTNLVSTHSALLSYGYGANTTKRCLEAVLEFYAVSRGNPLYRVLALFDKEVTLVKKNTVFNIQASSSTKRDRHTKGRIMIIDKIASAAIANISQAMDDDYGGRITKAARSPIRFMALRLYGYAGQI